MWYLLYDSKERRSSLAIEIEVEQLRYKAHGKISSNRSKSLPNHGLISIAKTVIIFPIAKCFPLNIHNSRLTMKNQPPYPFPFFLCIRQRLGIIQAFCDEDQAYIGRSRYSILTTLPTGINEISASRSRSFQDTERKKELRLLYIQYVVRRCFSWQQ